MNCKTVSYKTKGKNPQVKTIALDWLELNMKQAGSLAGDVFQSKFFNQTKKSVERGNFSAIHNSNLRSRVYSSAHEIYYHGVHFATILHSPYTNVIKQYADCAVKIENSFLYANW